MLDDSSSLLIILSSSFQKSNELSVPRILGNNAVYVDSIQSMKFASTFMTDTLNKVDFKFEIIKKKKKKKKSNHFFF